MTVPGVGGRPKSFESPEQMQMLIDQYFDDCRETGRPLTVAGLADGIGCHTDTINEYQKNPSYSATIKRAKQKIEAAMAEYALTAKNPAGAIFLLKANYNYSDKLQIESTGTVVVHFDEDDRGLVEGE